MSSLRKLTPLFRLFFASLIVAISLVLLFNGASGPMNAQSPAVQERQVENTIKHAPLDVRVRKEKEKAWKDLKNENWVSDFEVEITNTGSKPIYTFGLSLYFDVPNDYWRADYFRADIIFGRLELSGIGAKPTADDIPLKPGESKVFTLHPLDVLTLKKGRREKGWRLPTKVKIKLGNLNFGDGTGFVLDRPVPGPNRSPETSKVEYSNSEPRRRKRSKVNWRSVRMDVGAPAKQNHNNLPAVLPVSYFRAVSRLVARDAAVPVDECDQGCFPGCPG